MRPLAASSLPGWIAILLSGCSGWGSTTGRPSSSVASAPPAVDPSIERKVDALLARMTLEEKIGQLNQLSGSFDLTGPPPEEGAAKERYEQIRSGRVGSMLNVVGARATRRAQQLAVESSRLGIPLLFGYDVIHGYRTMFPVPLAEAASWDLEEIEESARAAAAEAAASGVHWTFAPMVDICRDARWGRIVEGAGEDPYLGARVAAARVRGFQGCDLSSPDTIAACAKHYAAYGFAEAGRDYNTVDLSEATLRDVVLPPFRAALEAGVATFMCSFNEVNGVPASANRHLLREILLGEWRFSGLVVSDWGSIGELVAHGAAADLASASRLAIEAGVHMDMESSGYSAHLAALVESGEVSEALVDDAVRRILRLKFRLGLFDDPYRYSDEARERRVVGSDAHRALARDVARKSIVLLKNEGGLLPLTRSAGTLAVIGPLAADADAPLGSWRAKAVSGSAVSLLEGVRAAAGEKLRVAYAKGADLTVGERSFAGELRFNESDRSGLEGAVKLARGARAVVLVLGEDCWQSGEGRSQVEIGLKGVQEEFARAVLAANPKVVVVLMNGRPLAIEWLAEHAPAIVEAWHLGSEAGSAVADVLFGDHAPSGRLPVSFPRRVGQLPLYYDHKSTGRPGPSDMVFWSHYTDSPNTPLFPFGFGLGYTTFEYSPPRLSSPELAAGGAVRVSVTVKNTGGRAGAEVVQLYVRDRVGSRTRPILQLAGFRKIELEPGASREVTFELRADDLAFTTLDGERRAEPGEFDVYVGSSSRDLQGAELRLR